MYKWNLKNKNKPATLDELNQMLIDNRKIKNNDMFFNVKNVGIKEVRSFLGNDFFVAINKAVKCIFESISNGENIVIHGDYDADGVTSTALLWQAIYEEIGYKNVFPYIPSRFEQGYGLSYDSLKFINQKYFEDKKGLLITVDCGITAVEQVKYAKQSDIKVLLTDHHQKSRTIPKPDVLLWTDKLCGVGIAYFLAKKLLNKDDFGLDLFAIGTVADLQPLTNVNRILVKKGLEQINLRPRLGIKKLLDVAGFERQIKAKDIGWVIAPRINASGRLYSAFDSLRLMCTKDNTLAKQLAKKLDNINKERKEKTESMIKIAEQQLTNDLASFIVSENFHEGIVGLVAGRLTQKYYKPALVLQVEDNIAKGSARSIPEIDIIKLLRQFEGEFINLGGHSAAAGFSIKLDNVENLKTKIFNYLNNTYNNKLFSASLSIEFPIDLDFIGGDLWNLIMQYEPFGIQNKEPLFLLPNLRIVDIKSVGKGKHLSLNLTNEKHFVKSIAFGMGSMLDELDFDTKVDVVGSILENVWNGNTSYQIKISDIKKVNTK